MSLSQRDPDYYDDEIKEYILKKLEKFSESINKAAYLEAKELLNAYFGEENNQIVRSSVQSVINWMIDNFGEVKMSLLTNMRPDHIAKAFNQCNVYVLFPEVTITNGRGDSKHIIKELWVRFDTDEKFSINNLCGARSYLTYGEALVGYRHSHLHSNIPNSHIPPSFGYFCLGTGEINQVIASININGFNKINFTLFCIALITFVAWESIDGTPYIRYSSVESGRTAISSDLGGNNSNNLSPISYSVMNKIANWLKEDIITTDISTMKSIINISVVNDEVTVIPDEPLEIALATIITFASTNRMRALGVNTRDSIVCRKLPTGEYISLDSRNRDRSRIRLPDRSMFKFKDREIFLKIEGLQEATSQNLVTQNQNTYAHPAITTEFCRLLASEFPETCFKFEKVIKENTLENLLQATGPNLLPV